MFQYHADILERFPKTRGGIILASGMTNAPTSDALGEAYQQEQHATINRIGETPLSELPSLSAWRTTFSAFGANPTKSRSAPEALLRRLTKKGDIPSINTLVDIGNLVSIRYALPVAVFDTRSLKGRLTVKFSKGTERYTELGSDEVRHPDVGEVIFADETDLVFARRWCWRQSLQSASKIDTTDAIIVVEAQHENNLDDIQQAQADLVSLLESHAGGNYKSAILDKDRLAF